ncbi:MAG: single-stranded DNA-binding protein [Bacteroidia bacterium]|nr:single-stranded DNA-binding protein [Bacteroidia bacterium]
MSYNKIILIGNLGRDPEVKHLDNQKVVANFTLATNETTTDRNGEKRTETEWFNIEMWDNHAKIAEKYLKKGSQVYIEGKLKSETWKDREGVEKWRMRVRVQNFTLLGGNPNKSQEAPTNQQPTNTASESNTPPVITKSNDTMSDDLPF